MKVLGTGLSGLVGSRIIQLLSPGHTFENLSLETGVDITNRKQLDARFAKSDAPWVFHFAAYTDVQGAQKERARQKESVAWKINVIATEYIVENCRIYGKKLLYVDTDYAFDGTKKEYTEEDTPNPLCWYAETKYEGTKRVLSLGGSGLVIRIANPYRAHPVGKKDFVHKILERMQSNQTVTACKDQIFVPTFIDDIAYAISKLLSYGAQGVYHIVGSNPLSPYEAAIAIADIFQCDKNLVVPAVFAEMFRERAPVPQYAGLRNDKIQALGVTMRTFADGLREVKKQEQKNG